MAARRVARRSSPTAIAYGTSRRARGPADQPRVRVGEPHRPLHAGGGRWVAVGDAIANLLAAQGAEVHREYYLNDAGNQLGTFRDSLYARYRGEQPPGRRLPGPVPRRHGGRAAGRARRRRRCPTTRASGATARSSPGCRTTSAASACTSTPGSRSARCTSAATSPTCCASSTSAAVTYEADGATLAARRPTSATRATVCSSDRDGATTYLCNDLAYHRDKFARGFTHLIDIWGADHHGQVKSLQAGLRGARLPAAASPRSARSVREAHAGRRTRSASRSGPATSSRSPTSSTRSIPTSRA